MKIQPPPQLPDTDTVELDTEYASPMPMQHKSRNTAPPSTPPPARTASPTTEPGYPAAASWGVAPCGSCCSECSS
jgi:hypothetical protein